MQLPDHVWPVARGLLGVGLGGAAVTGLLSGGPTTANLGGSTLAASLLVVGLSGRHNLLDLSGWIAGGAILGGVLLYGVGALLAPSIAIELLVGAGVAVGGGLGGVTRLLGVGEGTTTTAEADTFTAGSDEATEASTPEPRPADLFEASPEPILYYDDAGDGPVVRAVNPAFETAFGVSAAAVEDAALGDALMTTADTEAIVAAASAGDAYAGTVTCETATAARAFAIRLASVSDEAGSRGYVLYTAVDAADE